MRLRRLFGRAEAAQTHGAPRWHPPMEGMFRTLRGTTEFVLEFESATRVGRAQTVLVTAWGGVSMGTSAGLGRTAALRSNPDHAGVAERKREKRAPTAVGCA